MNNLSWKLPLVGAVLLVTAGCGTTEQGNARPATGTTTTDRAAPSADNPAGSEEPCALLTKEQVSPYLGEDVSAPKPSTKSGGPSCDWQGDAQQEVELKLWNPPVPSKVTDGAKRTVSVGQYAGYVRYEAPFACMLDIAGPGRFLHLQVENSEKTADDGKLCDSVAEMAERAAHDLGW